MAPSHAHTHKWVSEHTQARGCNVQCSEAIVGRQQVFVQLVTFGQSTARLTRQWKISMRCVCVCVCACMRVFDCVWCETQCLACSPADFSRSPGSRSHSYWDREQFCEHAPTQIHSTRMHTCTYNNVGGKVRLCFTLFSSRCTSTPFFLSFFLPFFHSVY